MKLIENNLVIQQKGWQDDGSSVSPADHRFVSSVALLVDNHPSTTHSNNTGSLQQEEQSAAE